MKSAPGFSEAWLKAQVWPRFSRALAGGGTYLANHSLGRPPDRMAADVAQALDAWYRDMGDAWDLWLAKRDEWRALTAKLINAPSPDCIVPKTSAGQGLRAVLNSFAGKPRVLTTNAEFDSLDFILRAYREKGRVDLKVLPFDEFRAEPCELVVLSSVAFRTGAVFPGLAECVKKLRSSGACVLIDVYHHAGVLPLDVQALDVDFAVGGSYKYLRGGPGACWLYVHPRHHERRTLDTGWFAKKDAFNYQRPAFAKSAPLFAAGGDGWLESTPPVLGCFQALAGLEITLELGVGRIRAYNLEQKRFLASLIPDSEGAGEDHGAFITLAHRSPTGLVQALKDQGVTTDARAEYVRFCPDILNSREELEQAATLVAKLVQNLSAR